MACRMGVIAVWATLMSGCVEISHIMGPQAGDPPVFGLSPAVEGAGDAASDSDGDDNLEQEDTDNSANADTNGADNDNTNAADDTSENVNDNDAEDASENVNDNDAEDANGGADENEADVDPAIFGDIGDNPVLEGLSPTTTGSGRPISDPG